MTDLPDLDLAAEIFMAWVAKDIVVLDIRADTYVLIPDAAKLMQPVRNGGGVRGDAAVLDDLLEAGLAAPTHVQQRRMLTPAARDLRLLLTAPPISGLLAFGHAMTATAAFKRRNLAALVETARWRKRGSRSPDLAAAVRQAGVFEAVRPWVPFEGDCLQRSWMLHDHLCRNGLDADWVFGVRTWPFFAHCWVQIGDVVVGDTLNRVRGFTPIMAV